MTDATHDAALYLAVLPFYRDDCMKELSSRTGRGLRLFTGGRHIDRTVTTGIDSALYEPVYNVVLGGRALLQFGHWWDAISARTLVVDLNPRSATAWLFLLVRRALSRRTLVWGHLHPRAGGSSGTARVRRFMRRMASGTILYGYDSVTAAKEELPDQKVWVAPNALYRLSALGQAESVKPRTKITYVGRLEPSKKVGLLIRAFTESGLAGEFRLAIAGYGSEMDSLRALATRLGVSDSVDFLGRVTDPDDLRRLYDESLVSVSPGYVGLSLTQSLGFGVPMLVARDEPHAPEIELRRFGGVTFFNSDDSGDLAAALHTAVAEEANIDRSVLRTSVATHYSAEAMADGIIAAINARSQELKEDGWPAASK